MATQKSNNNQVKMVAAGQAAGKHQRTTLNWMDNYFSIEPEETFNDWRSNLPMTIKEALNDDEK